MRVEKNCYKGPLQSLAAGAVFTHDSFSWIRSDQCESSAQTRFFCVRLDDGFLAKFDGCTPVEHLPDATVTLR